jgi:hypothetical protein
MGWAKRLGLSKKRRPESALEAVCGFGAGEARALSRLSGCLELVERLHECHLWAGRDLEGDEKRVHELVLAAGEGIARQGLILVFDDAETEASRSLLAQIVLASYAWGPASIIATQADVDQQLAEAVAIEELIGRLGEATGEPLDRIRDGLPDLLRRRVMSYGMLNAMRQPLGVLAPAFRAVSLGPEFSRLRLDGVLIERDRERGGPGRELLVQVEPLSEEAVRAARQHGMDVFQFGAAEVLESFEPALEVIEHVRAEWDWVALGEAEEEAE